MYNKALSLNCSFEQLEADEPSDHANESSKEQEEETEKPKPKKNKKPKNKKKQKDTDNQSSNDYKFVSDFDTLDLNRDLNIDDINQQQSETSFINRELIKIETKHLSSDYEMVRKFGAKVVQSDRQQMQRGNNKRTAATKLSRFNSIVTKKPTWPPYYRNGLQMKLLNNPNSDILEFTFEHEKEYQQIQFDFLDAVDSLDHNHIVVRYL